MKKKSDEVRCDTCHQVIFGAVCDWWVVHQCEDKQVIECASCHYKRYEHDLNVEIEKRKLLERIVKDCINRY